LKEEYLMKRLVLVSIVLATIGTFAYAAPTVGELLCEDNFGLIECVQVVSCVGSCVVTLDTIVDAACLPVSATDPGDISLFGEEDGPDPVCSWTVVDTEDDVSLVVTMSEASLPVELLSFSVE
jgi:hypothetical protein